jgi:DNA mismatch endonuclease, patch repair protein
MTDILSKAKRSALMARVKGKNTGPEIIVRKFLFSCGLRYRINDTRYPGSPDIVLPKFHTAIFVHGCFWHGHENCPAFRIPKSNTDFWRNKIISNIKRDQQKIDLLEHQGWKVIVIWECQVKKASERLDILQKLIEKIRSE